MNDAPSSLFQRLQAHSWSKRILQLMRFGAVGVCATGIYFGLAMGLAGAGLPIIAAHAVAYAVSIVASYTGQKVFTFGVRGDHRRLGPRFICATILIASVQFVLVAFLKRGGASDLATISLSTLYYPAASFLVHTFWTFRTRSAPGKS